MFNLIKSNFDHSVLMVNSLTGKRGFRKFDEGPVNIIRTSIKERFGITDEKKWSVIETEVGQKLRNLRIKLVAKSKGKS